MVKSVVETVKKHYCKVQEINGIDNPEQLSNYYIFTKDNQIAKLAFEEVKESYKDNAYEEVIVKWKTYYLKSALEHLHASTVICEVVNAMKLRNVRYVILKGPIIAEYYPKPEYRQYGDLDILVHNDDLDQGIEALEDIGYKVDGDQGLRNDLNYVRPNSMLIELHNGIDTGEYVLNKEVLEESLLSNARPMAIRGCSCMAPSIQDHLVYLIHHASKHISFHGFGIRHLIDIHYLLESNGCVDWTGVVRDLELFGILRSGKYLMTLCKDILDSDVPESLCVEKDETYCLLYDFMMRKTAVNGSRIECRYVEDLYAAYSMDGQEEGTSRLDKLLFPSRSKLSMKYYYAKRWPALLPIAWLHRGFYQIFFERDRVSKVLKKEYDMDYIYQKERLLSGMGLGRRQ